MKNTKYFVRSYATNLVGTAYGDTVSFTTAGLDTIYITSFNTDPADWVKYSAAGNNWTWDATNQVMVANGYGGTAASSCYLISPAIDLSGTSGSVLTFESWTKYTDSGLATPVEVMISQNYSGNGSPSSATWTLLSCVLPGANSFVWTSSGNVDLSSYHGNVYIMFHYSSSGTGSADASKWEVDTFKVVGY